MPLKIVLLRPQNWSRLSTKKPIAKALLPPSRSCGCGMGTGLAVPVQREFLSSW